MSRVKAPHKTLKQMLKAMDKANEPPQPQQANLVLLAAMRGLVARQAEK